MNDTALFYSCLQGSKPYRLQIPVDEDGIGPLVEAGGAVIANPRLGEESILAVPLGRERYRLAENFTEPFCLSKLRWGDEFMARETVAGVLALTRVCYPAAYRHYTFVGGMDRDSELLNRIHERGGGWSQAAGIVTLSIPSGRVSDFNELLALPYLCGGVEFQSV